MKTYLHVLCVLVDTSMVALALLRVEHLPEQAEPVKEEAAVGRHGQVRGRQLLDRLGLGKVLGVGVHSIVADAIDDVAVLVATSIGAILLEINLLAEDRTGAVKHLVAKEVLVNVRVEQCPVADLLHRKTWGGTLRLALRLTLRLARLALRHALLLLLLLLCLLLLLLLLEQLLLLCLELGLDLLLLCCLLWVLGRLRAVCRARRGADIVHHAHRSADGTSHSGHVGHVDVIHVGRNICEERSTEMNALV